MGAVPTGGIFGELRGRKPGKTAIAVRSSPGRTVRWRGSGFGGFLPNEVDVLNDLKERKEKWYTRYIVLLVEKYAQTCGVAQGPGITTVSGYLLV